MAARSSGIFPLEGFSLDASMAVPVTTPAACPATLKDLHTIRVVVLGASITVDAEVQVTVGGQTATFGAGDLDVNGVGIAHIRGSLCDADNNMVYVTVANAGAVSVDSVYLDVLP